MRKKNPDLILMYFAGLASSKGGVGGMGGYSKGLRVKTNIYA